MARLESGSAPPTNKANAETFHLASMNSPTNGLPVHRDIAIGVLPKIEERLVCRERAHASRIRIRPVCALRLQRIGARDAEMPKRAGPAIPHHSAVVEDLLELDRRGSAVSRCKLGLASNVRGIEAREVQDKQNLAVLDRRRRGLERGEGPEGFLRFKATCARIAGSHRDCICVWTG
jgi:hypothetical protein